MYNFLEAALHFAAACENAGIEYFLGGSGATALHGEPRMTNDLDFVLDAEPGDVEALVRALGEDFEADVDALRRAARQKKSWNIFYLPDFTKVDIFFKQRGEFDRAEFERRQALQVGEDAMLWVKSPEDSVLRKLLWFVQGGRVSDRQWRDIVATLASHRAQLDEEHLSVWATRLGVDELLQEARRQAAPSREGG